MFVFCGFFFNASIVTIFILPLLHSIEYWFRCLDIDGDGLLSLYELELFYDEVLQRLRELSIESLSVENTVCQVLDMVNPREESEWREG